MKTSVTEEEYTRILNTPNKELSTEELELKINRNWQLSRFLASDGVDNLADERATEAILAQKELDERNGIFGRKYNFPNMDYLNPAKVFGKKRKRRKKTLRRGTAGTSKGRKRSRLSACK